MSELWDRILVGAQQIGSVVPALVGAAVILLTGYFLARQVQRWADDTLKRLISTGWPRPAAWTRWWFAPDHGSTRCGRWRSCSSGWSCWS